MILKWLVLAAIVVCVWYGSKVVIRRNKARQIEAGRRRRGGSVEDLRACSVCDSYVAEGQRGCGRDDCPYPG